MIASALLLLPALAAALPAKRDPIVPESTGYDLACRNDQRALNGDCVVLLEACNNSTLRYTNPWGVSSCVAAATCSTGPSGNFVGPGGVYTYINCHSPIQGVITPHQAPSLPNLDYSIYAKIVGSCAYANGGCPITQQNYIDFYYGQLTAAGAKNYPSDVVDPYYKNIIAWTKTPNNAIPYTNFNDYLHFFTNVDVATSQIDQGSCQKIIQKCVGVTDDALTDPFSHIECVVGSVCTASNYYSNISAVLDFVQHSKNLNSTTPQQAISKPRVSHAVFQKLSNNGAAITLQTLTDAYYGQCSAIGGTYPASSYYIQILYNLLTSWTGQCNGIAEGNFADYIQYSTTVQSNIKC